MTRFGLCIVLAVLLAAGCAGAPEVADEAAPPPVVASTTPTVTDAAATASTDAVLVVDVNELVAATPPPLICRQMLKGGSNVIVTRCLSEKDWQRFYRQEEIEARKLVRLLQEGRYR